MPLYLDLALILLVLSQEVWRRQMDALSLVYKNSIQHKSLKMVHSHDRESLLWHWTSLISPLWKGYLCHRSFDPLDLPVSYSPSLPLHSDRGAHFFSLHIEMLARWHIHWLPCLLALMHASRCADGVTHRCHHHLGAKQCQL